ncbi:MAG TPA: TVP38/TMEM64 family protein [Candidatus Dependentiae bacterium]|nr:TVP38/TMEM64 family protein [Candidatus Dependentiae bacterium]
MNKKLIVLFILVGIIIMVRFSGITEWVSLAQLKMHRDYLQQVIANHYLLAVLFYISCYITAVAFSLPIGAILTVAGGFLFGIIAGTFYTNIGATVGATIAFFLVRYLIGDTVQQKYAVQLARFNKSMEQYGSNYLLVIRFIAVIPFFLVNILAGLTNLPLLTFIWTTAIGILPGSLVYTFAGQQLNNIEAVSDIFSFNMLLVFFFLAFFALLPVIVTYMQQRYKAVKDK